MAFCGDRRRGLRAVARAPRRAPSTRRATSLALPRARRRALGVGFDQVWQTLKSLYYATGPSAAAWDALATKYRPQAAQREGRRALEDVIDAMIAEQPLDQAGRRVLARGRRVGQSARVGGRRRDAREGRQRRRRRHRGGVRARRRRARRDEHRRRRPGDSVPQGHDRAGRHRIQGHDAEPRDARQPEALHADGRRTATDGPTVANIPGVVAGLDLLYQKYGSKKVAWADLVAPAIKLADEGFVLDEALPTTIAEGRAQFAKYPEAAKIFLPGGKRAAAGRSLRQQGLRRDAADASRRKARSRSIADRSRARSRTTWPRTAASSRSTTSRSTARWSASRSSATIAATRSTRCRRRCRPARSSSRRCNILDNYQPRPGATYATDADYLHYAIEAWRVRDGGGRIADPERWPVDYGNHLDPAHALERFKLIDPKKVYAAQGGGRGGRPRLAADVAVGAIAEDETGPIQTGTTAFVVADAEGNMIAFTQTLSTWGGNFYVSKGLGFLYNDHFRGGGGRGRRIRIDAAADAVVSSTSVPTLVFAPSDRRRVGRYGIPGSRRGWRSAAPATPGFPRRSTTSS